MWIHQRQVIGFAAMCGRCRDKANSPHRSRPSNRASSRGIVLYGPHVCTLHRFRRRYVTTATRPPLRVWARTRDKRRNSHKKKRKVTSNEICRSRSRGTSDMSSRRRRERGSRARGRHGPIRTSSSASSRGCRRRLGGCRGRGRRTHGRGRSGSRRHEDAGPARHDRRQHPLTRPELGVQAGRHGGVAEQARAMRLAA